MYKTFLESMIDDNSNLLQTQNTRHFVLTSG